MQFQFTATTLRDTEQLAAALAEALPEGVTVALCGTLGAGKTQLVRAIAKSWDVSEESVVSPTFVLCQQYQGKRTILHYDAYRVADEDEFLDLGIEEQFDTPAVIFIEWADRVANCLPPDRIEIDIEVSGETSRSFRIRSCTTEHEGVIERIASVLSSIVNPKQN